MDAVLNWIWQGLAVAAVLSLMLRGIAGATAAVRYVVCGLALVIVLALPALWSVSSTSIASQAAAPLTVAPLVAVPDTTMTSPVALLLAWLLWVGTQCVVVTRSLLSAGRLKRGCRPFPADIERRLHHWQLVRGDGRPARLAISDRVGRAAMLGGSEPVIAIAPQLLDRLSADELDHVVLHEWAHVQRRDDLANFLQLAIRVIAGWHPAVWWIDRRLRIEREVACDETAVALGGSPKSYATCLVKLSEVSAVSRLPLAAANVLTPGSLRYRVTRIIAKRPSMSRLWSRSLAIAMVAALLFLATGIGHLELFADAWVLPVPVQQTLRRSLPLPVASPRVDTTSVPNHEDSPTRATIASRTVDVPAVHAPARDTVPAADATPTPVVAVPHDAAIGDATAAVPEAIAHAPTPDSEPAVPTVNTPAVEPATIDSRSTWVTAADAGVAIGRGSKAAGVATAGAFTRFARRVAGSF